MYLLPNSINLVASRGKTHFIFLTTYQLFWMSWGTVHASLRFENILPPREKTGANSDTADVSSRVIP